VEGRPRPACGACGFVWYQDPKVAACTIPEVDGRLVLVRRGIEPARGRWVFPGGYMDRGETVAEAAVRETLEETGLSVEVRGLSGVYSYRESIVVVVVYRVAVLGGVMRPGNECLEVRAFGGDEVPWEELAFPSTRDALRDYLGRGDGG
jgi:8-oxo-dGTP diphosphatase